MSLFNTFTLNFQNYTGSYVNGKWVDAADGAPVPATGSWQPATGEAVQVALNGRRAKSANYFITESNFNVDKQSLNGVQGRRSTAIVGTDEYEIINKDTNQNGIINHYRYLCIREKEKEAGKQG